MPKGGDLHSHLSGAIYAESMIDWAAEDGLCVDTKSLVLQKPPCDAQPGVIAAKDAQALLLLPRELHLSIRKEDADFRPWHGWVAREHAPPAVPSSDKCRADHRQVAGGGREEEEVTIWPLLSVSIGNRSASRPSQARDA